MATAGEGRATYESSGAGGKFRKRPLRRSAQATPYDRPPTALRNNKPGLLTKLVDPASRLIYAGAHKLFGVFRKRLPPLSLQGPPEINEEPQNVSQESRRNNSTGVSKQDGDSASISAATGISELEQMLKQKTFSRSEIQHLTELLHSRTTESPFENMVEINKASPSSLLMLEASTSGSMKKHRDNSYNFHAAMSTPLISSKVVEERTPSSPAELAKAYMATSLHKPQPITSMTPNPKVSFNFKGVENGFLTPRSRGRSAMYSMARTPYSKTSSSNFNQKGAIMTSYSSQSLKRRSSVLDDDFGSVGPLRRTRQKPNLLSQSRYKSELGYTTFQQPPNEPEEKSKSKSTLGSVPEKSTQTATTIFQQLERLTPPKSPTKLTSSMLHGQALRSLEKVDSIKSSEVQVRDNNGESASTSTSTSKGKEKVEENGSRKFPVPVNMLTTTVNGDVAVSVKESEQIVVNDDLDLKLPPEPPQKRRAFCMSAPDVDDDDDDDVDDVIHVNGHENNKPVSADIIEPPTPPEVSKTPVVVAEVAKVSEPVELKEPEKAKPPPLKTDGNVIEQETGFKFPTSTFTTQKDKVTPTENVLPFQFSDFKPKESLGPKPVDSASVFSSDQFKVTNKDENGNDQKVENSPAAMFSFASSAKNSSGPTPTMTPDSGPSVFSSSTPFPASDGNTNLLFNNTSNSNITPATSVLSTSLPTPVFSFGSANKPTTSVAETSNTDAKPTSVFAATTTTAPTGGGGLFGFSSPAATSTATTTTTTNAGALFGFSAPAATSTAITTTTTTTNGGGLLGFSAPAATSTTTPTTKTNGGALFGFSSPAATSTTTTATNGGAPFGFSAPAATSTTTTATTTNGGAYFGFSAPAATSTTTNAATTNGNLFGFSAPAATSTTTTTTAPFFNTTTTSQTTTQPSSTPITQSSPFQFGSGSTTSPFGSSSTFNITSMAPTSDPKPGNSTSGPTTTVFGSSWQTPNPNPNPNPSVFSFGASSSSATTPPITFGASNPSTGPTTFSFNTSGPTKPSFTTTSQVFGTPTTVFANNNNNNNNNNNDQMSMEDSMAEDSNPVSPFGQAAAPVAAVAPPGFMFGSGPPPQQVAAPFQFGGGQTNQVAPPQNPFQSSSLEFNGGGGSFSLGSGGDKSGRRIVRVNKSKNRRK